MDYPVAFDIVWQGTDRHGSKFAALKAWVKAGKPGWDVVQPVWHSYMLSERPRAGFVMDLATWFNKRCHEQEWTPAPQTLNGARPIANGGYSSAALDIEVRRTDEALAKKRAEVDPDKMPDWAQLRELRGAK